MRNLLFLIPFLFACNNDVKTEGVVTVTGKATVEVTVSLEVLNQLQNLCTMQLASVAYPSDAERQSAIASCVFQHFSNVGGSTAALSTFGSTYCGPNANLSQLTPEQIISVQQSCSILGL